MRTLKKHFCQLERNMEEPDRLAAVTLAAAAKNLPVTELCCCAQALRWRATWVA